MVRIVAIILLVTSTGLPAFVQNDEGKMALARVLKLGGKVERTPQLDGTDLIGIDLNELKITDTDLLSLRSLKYIKGARNWFLQGVPISDEGVTVLAEISDLNVVYLDGTKVTGHGLKNVKVYWLLSLRDTPVKDEGIKALSGHKHLQQLDLSNTQITDAGLRALKDLKQLRTLRLQHTKITDAGIAEVSALAGLQNLSLDDTKITNAGLKELKKVTSLQRLDLNGTAITATGLAELKDLPGLASLQLSRTKLTDTDLEIFKLQNNFKSLRDLWVGGTLVTKQGLRALHKARPGLSGK